MDKTFADVVDKVRQLSTEEREELIDVLKHSIIEERRHEILKNCEEGMQEYSRGNLKAYTDVDELMKTLDD